MSKMQNIRKDIRQVMDATKAFYASDKAGMALLKIKTIGEITKPAPRLKQYKFPDDTEKYLDDCAVLAQKYWSQRLDIQDYTIPYLGPWYGIAEHSSFLGGEVKYEDDTSWQEVVINDLSDLSMLSMDESNTTYQMVVGGIKHIKKKYGDIFVPMVRGTSGVLEIANALRGNELFYDFYEEPEKLHTLLAYCRDAIIWYYNKQLDAAGEFAGGTLTGFGEWLKGRAIGHLSEDTTTMISDELYREFGLPYTQSICDKFDAAFMHTHALGEHCLSTIAHIKGLKVMEISSDPNTERAIEVYKRNKAELPIIPTLCLKKEEIVNNMDVLKKQKTVIWYEAKTKEEAKEICNLIHKELPIL